MGHDVVGGEQVAARPSATSRVASSTAEELDDRLDPLLLRDLRDVGGGLDAERWDPARDHVLQQVAVVAREFDDQAVLVEAEALDRHLNVLGACATHESEYDEK